MMHDRVLPLRLRTTMDPRADLGEAAARILLHEVVPPSTSSCITPDLPVTQAKHFLAENGLHSVPVVDADGKLLGVVSRSNLMNVDLGSVSSVMQQGIHTLPEGAPIGFAIALLALEGLSEVPVVTEDGHVIGMYRALDALRWVAGRMGYVMPEAEAHL